MTLKAASMLLAANLMGASLSAGALAQSDPNPELEALNGPITLFDGFPQSEVTVRGGGPIVVAPDPSHGCPVHATEAATLSLNMDEDQPSGFDIYARGNDGAALLVVTPDGDWLCNSASGDRTAVRRIADPVPGDYQIWVSEPESSDEVPIELTFTEVEVVGRGLNAVPRFSVETDGTPFQTLLHGEGRRISPGQTCDSIVESIPPTLQVVLTTPDGAEALPGMGMAGMAENTYGVIFQDPTGAVACQIQDTTSVGSFRTMVNRPAGVYRVWVTVQHTVPARLLLMIAE